MIKFVFIFNSNFTFYCFPYKINLSAGRIWEISDGIKNSLDFLMELNNSDLSELGFSDGFIFELWGVITDARDGRI